MQAVLDLRDDAEPVAEFLAAEIGARSGDGFRAIGVYACAWSGWVSLCFSAEIPDAPNCPDMDLVEAALLERPEWAEAYESGVDRIIGLDGTAAAFGGGGDDEAFNAPVFAFLAAVARDPVVQDVARSAGAEVVVVQMLDSAFMELVAVG